MPTHLFVYGTLMRGESRHRHLSGETFVANVRSAPGYRLYDAVDYPALVEDPDGPSIVGELWLVSDAALRQLDDVEGVDEGLYARRRIPLLPPQDDVIAEAYVYLEPVVGLPEISPSWRDRPH
jgi:gamma-glutamylaminecyclotransferase